MHNSQGAFHCCPLQMNASIGGYHEHQYVCINGCNKPIHPAADRSIRRRKIRMSASVLLLGMNIAEVQSIQFASTRDEDRPYSTAVCVFTSSWLHVCKTVTKRRSGRPVDRHACTSSSGCWAVLHSNPAASWCTLQCLLAAQNVKQCPYLFTL